MRLDARGLRELLPFGGFARHVGGKLARVERQQLEADRREALAEGGTRHGAIYGVVPFRDDAGGKAGPVTRATEGGEPVFTTEIARNGESYAVSVSPDGKWYSVEIDLSAAPPAVQRKARELAAPGSLDNVAKVLEDGVIAYEVEVTLKGRYHSYTLGRAGRILSHSEELQLTELSEAVRRTLARRLDLRQPFEIYRVQEAGETYLQAEGKKDGREISLNLSPEGRFLGEND